MEKPAKMSLKEWLIKKVSGTLIIPEKVVEAVVSHQFDTAYTALDTNNSVEIYEFGKFIFKVKKAEKEMEKYISQKEMYDKMKDDESLSKEKRRNAGLRMETAIKNIEGLRAKINKGNEENNKGDI